MPNATLTAQQNKLKFELFKNLILSPIVNGGGDRDRTCDLLRARQLLSQLSYTPRGAGNGTRTRDHHVGNVELYH